MKCKMNFFNKFDKYELFQQVECKIFIHYVFLWQDEYETSVVIIATAEARWQASHC